MPGLIFNIGGKLDSSYKDALYRAAQMAQQEQRRMAMISKVTPTQLAVVNRALANLPTASLMRPRLEAIKQELINVMGVAGGQAGGSFFGRFVARIGGAGGQQLVHVFRATFDSLASGISPWRVLLQQGPQAAQALRGIGGSLIRFFFNPITLAAGATIAAVGVLVWHFHKLRERAANLASILGPVMGRISDETDAVNNANREHEKFAEWLRRIGDEADTLPAKLDRIIKRMREEADIQRQLAQARGASAQELERMNQAELQKELLVTKQAALEAKRAEEAAKGEVKKREAAYEAGMAGASGRETVKTEAQNKKALLDAAQAALDALSGKTIAYQTGDVEWSNALHTFVPKQSERSYNESDALTFKVNGKEVTSSVAAARKAYEEAAATANHYAEASDSLNSELEKAKKAYQESVTASKNLADKELEVSDQLALRKKYGQQLASIAGTKSGGINSDLTANQRVGAYAMFQNLTIVDLTRTIANNTGEMKSSLNEIKGRLPADVNGPFQ